MGFIGRKRKLGHLLIMIKNGGCISLAQSAETFSCSKRTIRRMLVDLRDEGHNIRYSKTMRKFYL